MQVNFYPRKSDSELKPVFLFVTMFGKQKELYSTGYKVLIVKADGKIRKTHWDSKKQRIKESVTGHEEVNNKLISLTKKVKSEYDRLIEEGTRPTFEALKRVLEIPEESLKENKPTCFVAYMKSILDKVGQDLESGEADVTKSKYYHELTTFRYLEKYNNLKKVGFLLDEFFYKDFIRFLANYPIKEGEQYPMLNNTIGSHVAIIRKYCQKAFDDGLLKSQKYLKFVILKEKRLKKYSPTENDIIKVYYTDFYNKMLSELLANDNLKNKQRKDIEEMARVGAEAKRRAVDSYTFRYYAGGFRVGESKNISSYNIIDVLVDGRTHKGVYFVQNKTGEPVTLLLNEIQKEILERYNYSIPTISGQKLNDNMKEAFRLTGGFDDDILIIRHSLKEKVQWTEKRYEVYGKSHGARYGAAKYLNKKSGGNVVYVKNMLGHSDIRTTLGYIEEEEQEKLEIQLKIIGK